MKRRMIAVLAILIMVSLMVPSLALGQPMVCNFHGSVTLDGVPVANGTVVKAWIDQVEVKSVTTTNSNYTMNIAGLYTGKTVFFTVGGAAAPQSALWEAGASKTLSLTAASAGTPVRALPDTVSPGQTFDVTVTFASPANGFNTIGLTDLAPGTMPIGWTKAQREGTNAAFYHPANWIIMLDQPAPTLIFALDPTFFPNVSLSRFELGGVSLENFVASFISTKLGPVMGFTNVTPLPGGTMTLANGINAPYIMFTGDKSGYNMQAKGVFLQDGTDIYYMQAANFPFMWNDSLTMVNQILGTLHIASGTASAGWPVAVNSSWCTPVAQAVTATGNRAEIAWWQQGGFNSGTAFTAVYHVTVPTDAVIGNIYTFPNGTLEYRINGSNPATVMPITGDSQVQVNTAGRSIIITPATGPRGTNVSVTGSGFTPGTSVDISFGGVIVTASTTNAAGAFTAAFAVPLQATSGANAVVATDGAGLTASATFTVPPAAITVSPTSGPPGTTVTVMGTGFPAYLSLTLILDAAIVTPSPVVITDASGDFTATFVVLGLAPGLHTVSATCGGVVATAVFTITNQQHYTLTTSVDPAASGSVSLNPTQPAGGYNSGTLITLTPNPATGYVFDHWSGDVTGTANPGSVTMNSNKSITAHFAPPGVTVTVNAPARVSTNYDFTVSIDISEVTDLNSVQYDIGFDTSVLRLDSIDAGQIAATSIPVASNEISGGHYRVVQSLGLSSVSGSGSLAVLHFHSIGAIGTSSAIDISNGLLSGMSGGIPATWVDDTVQVSVIPGDANGDGAVNVLDMTKVAREILQLDQLTPGADANLDGLVNVLDMTKIARIILLLDPS